MPRRESDRHSFNSCHSASSSWQQPNVEDGRAPFGTGIYLNSLQTSSRQTPKKYNNNNNSTQLSPEITATTTSISPSVTYTNLNRRLSRSLNAEDFNSIRLLQASTPTIKSIHEAENYRKVHKKKERGRKQRVFILNCDAYRRQFKIYGVKNL